MPLSPYETIAGQHDQNQTDSLQPIRSKMSDHLPGGRAKTDLFWWEYPRRQTGTSFARLYLQIDKVPSIDRNMPQQRDYVSISVYADEKVFEKEWHQQRQFDL